MSACFHCLISIHFTYTHINSICVPSTFSSMMIFFVQFQLFVWCKYIDGLFEYRCLFELLVFYFVCTCMYNKRLKMEILILNGIFTLKIYILFGVSRRKLHTLTQTAHIYAHRKVVAFGFFYIFWKWSLEVFPLIFVFHTSVWWQIMCISMALLKMRLNHLWRISFVLCQKCLFENFSSSFLWSTRAAFELLSKWVLLSYEFIYLYFSSANNGISLWN